MPPTEPIAAIAVDGGNSKTDALALSATGAVLGSARGPASGHQLVGMDAAMDALAETITAALEPDGARGRGGPTPPLPLAVLCLAGLDLPIDEERLAQAVTDRNLAGRFVLHNDTMAILRAGVEQGYGVAVVCGTGINCAGLGPDGATVRFPSLGELSGDLAHGGLWLGVRGLALAVRAVDGRGAPSALAQRVPEHFGLDDPMAVVEAVYTGTLPYGRLAELAEVVLDLAAGDQPARGAADQLADEVVSLVVATVERLDMAALPVEVVLGGGVFATPYAGFHGRIRAGISAVAPTAVLRTLTAPPVVGAGLLALDAMGAEAGAHDRLRNARLTLT